MNSLSNFGVLVLLVSIILSRIISERALKQLTPEEKVMIIDSFSKFRTYSLIPLVVIVFAFFSAKFLMPTIGHKLYLIFLIALFAFLIVLQLMVFKKLKALKVSYDYTNTVILSKVIVIAGFAVWIGITIYPYI